MARIAGLVHWGALTDDYVKRCTFEMIQHMTSSEGELLGTSQGVLAVQGLGGGFARQGERILVLDGRLLERGYLTDDSQDDDAKLLLKLCLRHGFEQAIARIDGDFSVVFLDASVHKCWLARDRFGVKPLYYADTRWGFAFASQPAPLARLEAVGADVNRRYVALIAASHYRTFDNAIEESPFASVSQLPAAHWLEANPQRLGKVQAYWRLQAQPLINVADEAHLAEHYRELLLAAVQRRLAVAENPAFTLSGGMDSSSILCSAAKLTGIPQVAFSSIYKDPTYDERHEIQDVIDAGHARWHPIEVAEDLDLPSTIARLVAIHNEPVATATWLSHDRVCQGVTDAGYGTLFGGLGGDELNAGEYEYFPLFFADIAASGDTKRLEEEIAAWARYHDHPIHRKNSAIARQLMNTLTLPHSRGHCRPNLERQNRYLAALNPEWFDLSHFEPVMEHPFDSFLANRAYQDLTRETTPCCLRAEDRQCSAYGLEHFDPFLDRELVEFMFSVPYDLKIRAGVTKYLLRQATTGILPKSTRERIKKTGWNAPAHLWFCHGHSFEALMDLVHSASFRNRGIYNLTEVSRLIEEHKQIVTQQANQENHMMFLWQLLNLEYWYQWLDSGTALKIF